MIESQTPENTFEESDQIIRDTVEAISQRHGVEEVSEPEEAQIQEQLSQFDAFDGFQQVFLDRAIKVSDNERMAYLTVLSLNAQPEGLTAHQVQSPGMTEMAFAGLVHLDRDFGQVEIRPESTMESLIDWVYPTKVRFDIDSDFSKKYRVMAEDPEQVKDQATEHFLETIKQYEGLHMEIRGKNMMVRLPKGLSMEIGQQLTDFMVALKRD